jgi:hypothetical protein
MVKRITDEWEARHPGTVITQGEPLGDEGEALWRLITWELEARIAMGTLGDVHPSEEDIHKTAYWLAEQVTWMYRIERRPKGEIRRRSLRSPNHDTE